MTESEWVCCNDPGSMLEHLRGKKSHRKVRLFGCACCRRIWHLLQFEASMQAVEISEKYADSSVNAEILSNAYRAGHDAYMSKPLLSGFFDAAEAAAGAANPILHDDEYILQRFIESLGHGRQAAQAAAFDSQKMNEHGSRFAIERSAQCVLLRDIFGNPFRPVTLDPRWLTSTVLDLARTIYDERAFERMPILADALMDAGCDSETLINHCRSDGPHVRGCWVVDLLLGKT